MEMGYILGPLSAITELFLNTFEEIVGKHAPARVIVIYTTTLVLWTSEICLLKKIRSTIVYMLSYFSGQNTLGQSDPLCPIVGRRSFFSHQTQKIQTCRTNF